MSPWRWTKLISESNPTASGWGTEHWATRPGMVCYQYDFATGKRRKLFTSDDQGEILRAEKIAPSQ